MGWLNRKKTIFASLGVFAACFAGQAEATENGASLYLLGSGGPGTAVMAPFEGVYLDKLIWIYDGNASASREFCRASPPRTTRPPRLCLGRWSR